MKKLGLFAAIATACLCGQITSVQAANTNSLLVTIQITGLIQQQNTVTNQANPNITTTTYTTKSAKIAGANILEFIQTEFGSNFPTGAQLGYDLHQNGFVVLDQNQNLIMSAGANPSDDAYYFGLSNNITGAGAPMVQTGKQVENTGSTNQTITATLAQPDYGVFYTDSHGNSFHFDGLIVVKANEIVDASNTRTYTTASILLNNGSGGGEFFNHADGKIDTAVFTSAKFSALGKNVVQ